MKPGSRNSSGHGPANLLWFYGVEAGYKQGRQGWSPGRQRGTSAKSADDEDGTRQRRQSPKSVGRRAATARSADGEVGERCVDDETSRSVRL